MTAKDQAELVSRQGARRPRYRTPLALMLGGLLISVGVMMARAPMDFAWAVEAGAFGVMTGFAGFGLYRLREGSRFLPSQGVNLTSVAGLLAVFGVIICVFACLLWVRTQNLQAVWLVAGIGVACVVLGATIRFFGKK